MNTYFYAELIHHSAPFLQIAIIVLSDLLTMLGMWGIFKKAGRSPFLALIPGVNEYTLFSLAWSEKFGFLVVFLKVFFLLLYPKDGHLLAMGIQGCFCFGTLFLSFVLSFIMRWKLSVSFQKNSVFAFYLNFLPQIFFPILGFDRSVYLGPTLRRYNSKNIESAENNLSTGRQMMISLNKRRSVTALVSAVIVCVCTSYAVGVGLLETYSYQQTDSGYSLFKYFTTNSNTLSAIGAAFLIPYAVEGVRVKRFCFPKWVGMIQYSGAICTTLTMAFAFLFILPTQGKQMALGGMNFWLHLVCPIMALILFLSVESDFRFSFFDSLICLAPFFLYAAIYMTSVVMVGEEYGGWQDLYHLTDQLPPSFAASAMCAFALAVALVIGLLYNSLSVQRRKKMMSSWEDSADPKEIEEEAHDLGWHYGLYDDRNDMTIPVDILRELSQRYNVEVKVLYQAYVDGMSRGLAERKERLRYRPDTSGILGTPRDLAQNGSEDRNS